MMSNPRTEQSSLQSAVAAYNRPRRLHPLTIFYQAIVNSPQFIIPFYIGIKSLEEGFFLIFSLVIGALFFPALLLRYLFFSFSIGEEEIVIESGVFSRNRRVISLRKIQNIAIEQNFLQRLFFIANVSIETAGSQGAEGSLQYVSKKAADEIREVIRTRQERLAHLQTSPADAMLPSEITIEQQQTSGETTPAEQTSARPNEDMTLPLKQIISGGFMHFRPIVLLPIAYLMQYANYGNEELYDRIISYFVSEIGAENVNLITKADIWQMIAFGLVFFVLMALLSWIFSALLYVNTYYGFRLQRTNNRFFLHHGLLSRIERAVPIQRVQMLTLLNNPLMRRYNRTTVTVHTAGSAIEKGGGAITLFPTAPHPEAVTVAQSIIPYQENAVFRQVSPLSIRRSFIRLLIPVLLATIPLTIYVNIWWLLFPLCAPLLYLHSRLRYKAHGFLIYNNTVAIKRRYIVQSTTFIPLKKIQTIQMTESFFQRRLGLASIHIDTAGLTITSDALIQDVPVEEAEQLMMELSNSLLQQVDIHSSTAEEKDESLSHTEQNHLQQPYKESEL